jgi:hypothetical protein
VTSSQEEQHVKMIKAIMAVDDTDIPKARDIIKKHFRPVFFELKPGDIL